MQRRELGTQFCLQPHRVTFFYFIQFIEWDGNRTIRSRSIVCTHVCKFGSFTRYWDAVAWCVHDENLRKHMQMHLLEILMVHASQNLQHTVQYRCALVHLESRIRWDLWCVCDKNSVVIIDELGSTVQGTWTSKLLKPKGNTFNYFVVHTSSKCITLFSTVGGSRLIKETRCTRKIVFRPPVVNPRIFFPCHPNMEQYDHRCLKNHTRLWLSESQAPSKCKV